jgi:hypothetical protein
MGPKLKFVSFIARIKHLFTVSISGNDSPFRAGSPGFTYLKLGTRADLYFEFQESMMEKYTNSKLMVLTWLYKIFMLLTSIASVSLGKHM